MAGIHIAYAAIVLKRATRELLKSKAKTVAEIVDAKIATKEKERENKDQRKRNNVCFKKDAKGSKSSTWPQMGAAETNYIWRHLVQRSGRGFNAWGV